MNKGVCLVNNPETNTCSCQSGTVAKELFYTTATEQLGGGSHGGGITVVKREYYINVDKDDCLIILYFMQDKFDFHRDVIIYLMYPDFITSFYVLQFRRT